MPTAGGHPRSTAEPCTAEETLDTSQALRVTLQRPAAHSTESTQVPAGNALAKECAPGHVLYLQAGVPRCQHTAIRGPLDPCEVLGVCVKVLPHEKKTRQSENVSLEKQCTCFIPNAFGSCIILYVATDKVSACCPGSAYNVPTILGKASCPHPHGYLRCSHLPACTPSAPLQVFV